LKEDVYSDGELRGQILKAAVAVQLIVTPLCDYAQVKDRKVRILPGVLVPSKFRASLNSRSAYAYVSDANFRIRGQDCLFVFDFRYLTSSDKDEIADSKIVMRLKHQFLADVQVKLGSHINRSGIVYLG
jgi:hypothetical protein